MANLAWYDFENIRPATDDFWQVLRRQLGEQGLEQLPNELNRKTPVREQWKDERFLFGQACGFDVAVNEADLLQPLASISYKVPGCEGPKHRSFIVTHKANSKGELLDFEGSIVAINEENSNTGMNMLRTKLVDAGADAPFFKEAILTGSHQKSLEAVAKGRAELASVDCISWYYLSLDKDSPCQELKVIDQTDLVYPPPFVTSIHQSNETQKKILKALQETLANTSFREGFSQLSFGELENRQRGDYFDLVEMNHRSKHFHFNYTYHRVHRH